MALHTGEVLVATIGSPDRHEYTVIGDTVNVAARLNELCKEREVDLIVSGASYARAGAVDLAHVASDETTLQVRGRNEPVSFVEIG